MPLSKLTYSTKLAPDYARPSKQATLAYWAEMGLTGSYWRL